MTAHRVRDPQGRTTSSPLSNACEATVRNVADSEKNADDSWELVRPAGQPTVPKNPVHYSRPPSSAITGSNPADLFGASDESRGLNRPTRDRGTPLMVGLVSFVGMVIVGLVLVLVFDGGGGSTTPITSPVLSFGPQSTLATVQPETTPPSSVVVSPTSVRTTTTTIPIAGAPLTSTLLTAGPDGVYLVDPNGKTRVVDGSYERAFPLTSGSYLVQPESDSAADPADTTIYLVQPGAVPKAVITPESGVDEWLTLHDVIRRGGDWFALVSARTGTGPEDTTISIRLVGVTTGSEISFGEIDGWETRLGRLSIGNGNVVGEIRGTSGHSPLFLALDGAEPLDPTPLGLADTYDECDVCPRAFAIDEGGQRLAWVEGDVVVVIDIATADRLDTFTLPTGTGAVVESLELGTSSIVLNRRQFASQPHLAAWIIDADGNIATSPVPGLSLFSAR